MDDDASAEAVDGGEGGARRPLVARRALLDRVVERSGHADRAAARSVALATLATLGEVLLEGSDVDAGPLGKLKVTRERDGSRARILVLRLAVPKAAEPTAEAPRGGGRRRGKRAAAALAEDGEAG